MVLGGRESVREWAGGWTDCTDCSGERERERERKMDGWVH